MNWVGGPFTVNREFIPASLTEASPRPASATTSARCGAASPSDVPLPMSRVASPLQRCFPNRCCVAGCQLPPEASVHIIPCKISARPRAFLLLDPLCSEHRPSHDQSSVPRCSRSAIRTVSSGNVERSYDPRTL